MKAWICEQKGSEATSVDFCENDKYGIQVKEKQSDHNLDPVKGKEINQAEKYIQICN